MTIEITRADYANPRHAIDLVTLLDAYAQDPMGGGRPLPAFVKENLVSQLARRAHALSLLAYVDGQPAGLVNCFESFSTFQCKPILNIHDMVVLGAFRGLGLSQRLLGKVEVIARELGCCKLTLEVLEGNHVARNAYRKFGFEGYELDPAVGRAMFWEKPL